MDYYYTASKQLLTRELISSSVGIDPQTYCLENLISLGIYPVQDERTYGILDNTSFVVDVGEDCAYIRNSLDPLPLAEAKAKLAVHIKVWLNSEVKRLIENTGFSLEVILLSASDPGCTPPSHLVSCLNCVQKKIRAIHSLLSRIEESTEVETLKQLLVEFEQSEDLYGDP